MTTFGGWPQIGNCSFSNPNSIVNGPATIVPLGASSGGDGRDASSGGCLHDGAPPNVNSGVFCGAGSSGVEAGFGHGGYLGGSSWVAWPASNHQALRPNMAVGAATAAPEVGNHQMQTNCVDTGTGCGPDLGRTQVLDGPCVGSTTGVGVVHACNSSVSFGNSASTQSMPVPGAPVQLSVGQQSSAWGASVPMPILASPQQLPPSGQSSPSTQVSVSMGGDATPSVQAGGMLSPAMNSWPGMLSGNVANGKMPPLGRVPPGGGAGLDVVRAAMALVPAQVAQDPRGFSILCAVPSRRVNDLVGRDGSAAEQALSG
eukprot:TRINITY_DN29262_c0_g1_i2.p1 TRINITY_DN29262_c0_g1~~TRINITY_DN29262_c0_g1_i2.p1  ORF type:complete len:315 (-),score=36.60 TRINITY_DN29262_c0_g1_i2:20-964(-)